MAPKAADCKNVHNPNLQCKNDFLPYFDGFFLSLLKVYDHKIIFSWPLCIFGSKITKKNVSLIFYPKIPNPPPLRPLCVADHSFTSSFLEAAQASRWKEPGQHHRCWIQFLPPKNSSPPLHWLLAFLQHFEQF